MKKIIKWVTFWTILSLSFVLAASYLYCFANGYRINWQTKKVQRTGMIIVTSSPLRADVYIDNKLKNPTPVRISYILPGHHTVNVKINGYQVWRQNINVEEGYAVTINAELVFDKPVVSNNDDKNVVFSSANDPQINNLTEIWADGKLITRFSEPVLAAVWDNDANNIVYQAGAELRMISDDGLNDFYIASLETAIPVKIAVKNSTTLVYRQNDLQKQVQFRDRDSIPNTIKYLNF